MKDQTTNQDVFSGLEANVTSNNFESRKLAYTAILIDKAQTMAQELMLTQSTLRPELTDLVKKVLTEGQTNDVIELITLFYGETIKTASTVLDGCDAEQLDRLLESRRSDRSKTKKKGLTNMLNVKTYLACMIAELIIREKTGKAYSSTTTVEYDLEALGNDQLALGKKIKSLQSKKCRLAKIAQYDAAAMIELTEVNEEISRLNSLRPNTTNGSTTSIKSVQVDQLREIIAGIDINTLPADQQAKMLELMAGLK